MTDIRWRGVSHEQLYQWINSGEGPRASTPQLEYWKGLGQSLGDIHHHLTDRLGKLQVSWQGSAGGGAQRAVNPLQRWADEAQGHVRAMSRVAQNQADLIAAARAQMPEPQPHPSPQPAGWAPPSEHSAHAHGRGPAAAIAAQGNDLEIAEARAAEARERAIEVMRNYQRASEANRGGLGLFEEPAQVGVEVPTPRGAVRTVGRHGSAPPATGEPPAARHAAPGAPQAHGAAAAPGTPAAAGGRPARPGAGVPAGDAGAPTPPPAGAPGRSVPSAHAAPGGGLRPVTEPSAGGVAGTVAGVGGGVGVVVGGARVRGRSTGGKHRAPEPGDLPAGSQPGQVPTGQVPQPPVAQPLQPAQHTDATTLAVDPSQAAHGQAAPSPQAVTPQAGPAHSAAASPDVSHAAHAAPITPAAPTAAPVATGGAGGGVPAGQELVRGQSPLMRGATAGYQGFSGQGGLGGFGGQTHASAASGYGSGAGSAGAPATTSQGAHSHAASGYGQQQDAAAPTGYGEPGDGFAEPVSEEGSVWGDDRTVAPPVLGEDPPR